MAGLFKLGVSELILVTRKQMLRGLHAFEPICGSLFLLRLMARFVLRYFQLNFHGQQLSILWVIVGAFCTCIKQIPFQYIRNTH